MDDVKWGKIKNVYSLNSVINEGIWGVQNVVVTEKIHGTNARIIIYDDKVDVGSRTKILVQGGGIKDQYDKTMSIGESVRKQILDRYGVIPSGRVIIFGEYAGESIQKGIKYTESGRDFWAFGVLIGESCWLDIPAAEKFCEDYGVKFVPILYRGSPSMNVFNELYNNNSRILSIEDNVAEGIVIFSNPIMFDKFGSMIRAKHKNDKWNEWIPKTKKVKDPNIETFVSEYINKNRILHSVDKLREDGIWRCNMSDMRGLIAEIMNDLKQEVGLGDLDERETRKSVSRLVARIYKDMLTAGIFEDNDNDSNE